MSVAAFFKTLFSKPDRAPTDLELADMGLSRVDYGLLVSSKPGTRQRMETLAARFGVTPGMIDADHGLALELAQTCGHCGNAKACQNAIDLGVDLELSKCPNATIYADMSPA